MFFQMSASDNREPIEFSSIASFDANYSRSKTDVRRILAVWSTVHLPVLPLETKAPTMIRVLLRTTEPRECLCIRIFMNSAVT
jgi:hypothetical protein